MSDLVTKLLWIKRKLDKQKVQEDLIVRGEYVKNDGQLNVNKFKLWIQEITKKPRILHLEKR